MLAVDGGGSKTDVALITAKGEVLGTARGPTCSHELVGLGGVVGALRPTVEAALRRAGIPSDNGPVADVGAFALSGADMPSDDRRLARVLSGAGSTSRSWSQTTPSPSSGPEPTAAGASVW